MIPRVEKLARIVRKVGNVIHRINLYPVDSVVCFVNTYPLDSDLSGGWRYPAFEQLRPGLQIGYRVENHPGGVGKCGILEMLCYCIFRPVISKCAKDMFSPSRN